MEPTELILLWRFRIHRMQLSHYETALVFGYRHLWLGLPVIVLSTVLGISVLATIQKCSQTDNVPWLQILWGCLASFAAILASLQTFLRFSELTEKHRTLWNTAPNALMSSLFLFGMLIQFCKSYIWHQSSFCCLKPTAISYVRHFHQPQHERQC
jgi:hypothetical protein